jgi:hypothetical protein
MPFFVFLIASLLLSGAAIAACFMVNDRRIAVAVGGACAYVVLCLNALAHVRLYFDDAYITLRYSLNLSRGLGPVWNEGERVEGYTNFSWMLLAAGMHRAGLDLVDSTYIMSFIALAAVFWCIWLIWRPWADAEGGAIGHPVVPVVAMLAVALNGGVAAWGFSGLETPLAMALLTAGALLFLIESRTATFPWSSLVFVAGALTRPEMVGIAALTGAFAIARAYTGGGRDSWRYAAAWCVVFFIGFGAYEIWRYSYYGYPFPNTFYVKVDSTQEQFTRGMDYVRGWGMSYLFLPATAGLALLLFARTPLVRRDTLYLGAVVALWLAMVTAEGGDTFPQGRFLAPVVPILYLGGIAGLAMMLERAIEQRRSYGIAALTAAAVALLTLSITSADAGRAAERDAAAQRKDAGRLLKARLPDGYKIAVIAAGAMPYYYEGPALDMLGLTNETIAHTEIERAPALPGHDKYNIDYVLESERPEVILVVGYRPAPVGSAEIRATGSPYVPAHSRLVSDPRTWTLYDAVALRDDDLWFSFLQRKDTLSEFRPDWVDGAAR